MTEIDQQTAVTVSRLVVPASLDAPDAGPFLEMVRIANAVCVVDAGHDYLERDRRGGLRVLAGPDRLDADRLHRRARRQ